MIICVEGNIGAGKTSMLRSLERMGHTVVREPVKAWSYWLEGHGDKAFFQCIVLAWYIAVFRRLRGQNAIIERSHYTANAIFAASVDFGELDSAYQKLVKKTNEICIVDIYIFLSTPPSVCLQRLRRRQQPGDRKVTIALLREIDAAHWSMVSQLHLDGKDVYVF